MRASGVDGQLDATPEGLSWVELESTSASRNAVIVPALEIHTMDFFPLKLWGGTLTTHCQIKYIRAPLRDFLTTPAAVRGAVSFQCRLFPAASWHVWVFCTGPQISAANESVLLFDTWAVRECRTQRRELVKLPVNFSLRGYGRFVKKKTKKKTDSSATTPTSTSAIFWHFLIQEQLEDSAKSNATSQNRVTLTPCLNPRKKICHCHCSLLECPCSL